MKTKFFIYKITNLLNNKVYIGQTCNPKARWSRHKSDARLRKSFNYITRAIHKYKEENFIFEILFECLSFKKADELEIRMISEFKATNKKFGYNIAPGGQVNRLVSAKTRKKISLSMRGKQLRLGIHCSETTKKLISKALKNNKNRVGVIMSEETKNRLSRIMSGRKLSAATLQKKSLAMIGKNVGRKNGMYGRRAAIAKLTYKQATQIRYKYEAGKSLRELALEYKVSKKTILNIIKYRTYVK